MRAGQLFAARVTAALLSAALALLAAEGVLRVVYSDLDLQQGYWGRNAFVEDRAAGYRHAPGFVGRAYRAGVFDTEVRINSLGLRQSDLDQQLAFPGRLLVLGDSFAFGLGVREEETFVHLLEATLNPAGVGMINGGQSGYSIAQELALARDLAERLTPQTIVVCLFLENDVEDDYFRRGRRIEIEHGFRMVRSRWPRGPVFDLLRAESYLWRFAARNIAQRRERTRRQHSPAVAKRHREQLIEPAVRSIEGFVELCSARGVRLVVALVPRSDGTRRFEEAFKRRLDGLRVSTIDLADHGFAPDDYFTGDGHWNAQGHRKAAAVLSSLLLAETGPAATNG